MDVILAAGTAALPRETGGILAGFRTGDQVVVTRAAVVADASSSRREYRLLKRLAAEELARLKAVATPVVGFVGDWHTHPANVPPSSTDITSFELVAMAASDLVALIVLPFDRGEPCPAHVRVGRRVSPARRCRGGRVAIHHAVLTTTGIAARDLEVSANAGLSAKENPTS